MRNVQVLTNDEFRLVWPNFAGGPHPLQIISVSTRNTADAIFSSSLGFEDPDLLVTTNLTGFN